MVEAKKSMYDEMVNVCSLEHSSSFTPVKNTKSLPICTLLQYVCSYTHGSQTVLKLRAVPYDTQPMQKYTHEVFTVILQLNTERNIQHLVSRLLFGFLGFCTKFFKLQMQMLVRPLLSLQMRIKIFFLNSILSVEKLVITLQRSQHSFKLRKTSRFLFRIVEFTKAGTVSGWLARTDRA